jgi:hypothetical protein
MALGLAGGYLLGRTRKGRLLLVLAAAVASRGVTAGLAKRGAAALGSSPELTKLADQGREAAVAVLSNRIEGLTERIHARTEALRQPPGVPEPGGEEPEEPDRPPTDESAEREAEPEGRKGRAEDEAGEAEEEIEEEDEEEEDEAGEAEQEEEIEEEDEEGEAEEPEEEEEDEEGEAEEAPEPEQRRVSPARKRAAEPRTARRDRRSTPTSRRGAAGQSRR